MLARDTLACRAETCYTGAAIEVGMRKWLIIFCLAGAAATPLWLRNAPDRDTAHQEPIVTHCLRSLAYGDYETRNDARATLSAIGAPATEFVVRALDNRPGLFDRALTRFGRHIPWLRLQPSTDHQLRQRAAEQLAAKPLCDHPAALPALVRALADDSPTVVEEAQRSLRRLGPQVVLPAFARALESRDKTIRLHAAEVLRDLGHDAAPATPALRALLRDRYPQIRVVAAHALGNIGSESAVTGLVAALNDKSPSVRAAGAFALGTIGRAAASSAGHVRLCLADPDLKVRVASARALWQITGDAAASVPALVAALNQPDGWDSALALGVMREAASNAVPALIELVQREKVPRPLREMPVSALALGQIGLPAVPALIKITTHQDSRVRTSAAIALGFVGPKAADAVPHLVPLLRDSDGDVRRAATLALGNIDSSQHASALVPALIRLANDDDIFLSSLAASTLERVDPEAAARVRRE
jgi:HEAT repeat protein